MRYAVLIEQAESNYGGYVPDLPGCVALGKSVKETEQYLKIAIRMHLKGLKEDGLTIPTPTSICHYIETEDYS